MHKRPTRWTITGTKAKDKSTVQSTYPERICFEYHFCSPLNQQQDSDIVLDQKLDLGKAVGFKNHMLFLQDLDQAQALDLDHDHDHDMALAQDLDLDLKPEPE